MRKFRARFTNGTYTEISAQGWTAAIHKLLTSTLGADYSIASVEEIEA